MCNKLISYIYHGIYLPSASLSPTPKDFLLPNPSQKANLPPRNTFQPIILTLNSKGRSWSDIQQDLITYFTLTLTGYLESGTI